MKKHLNIKIYGEVQGVSFRYYSQEQALALDITGFVRNEPYNSIYIAAEGEEKNLQEFLKWCYQGPSLAKVGKVEVEEGEIKEYDKFEIRYG